MGIEISSSGGGGGTGNTTGAASSTDNAVVRFDGTGGTTLQNSVVTISDIGKTIIKGAGTAATSMLEVQDSAARAGFLVRENGTVVIDADVATGSAPLVVKYNAGNLLAFGTASATFTNAIIVAPTNAKVLNLGSGYFNLTTTGTASQLKLDGDLTNGAAVVEGFSYESITLSTSGTTTDSVANLLPADAIIESVMCRVTTTITTATDWSVGDATTATRFSSANATLTANTTSVGLNHMKGGVATDAAGPVQTAAAKIRITTTGTPGAGVVRVVVKWRQYVAPTS